MNAKRKPPDRPQRVKIPIVWLEVTRACDNQPQARSRKLVLKTRSHTVTVSELFGVELLEAAELATDQAAALRRVRDLILPAMERAMNAVVVARRDEVRANWTDKERESRGRADERAVGWQLPEADFFHEKPGRPHDC